METKIKTPPNPYSIPRRFEPQLHLRQQIIFFVQFEDLFASDIFKKIIRYSEKPELKYDKKFKAKMYVNIKILCNEQILDFVWVGNAKKYRLNLAAFQ